MKPLKHAVISTFDVFSIGIGPSSSHTVGPMRAAKLFTDKLLKTTVSSIRVDLFGSLALTGDGHGTPNAVIMGLLGETPELIDTTSIKSRIALIEKSKRIKVGCSLVEFDPLKHLRFRKDKSLPHHPNGMRIAAFDDNGDMIVCSHYYSIGGGFVVSDDASNDSQSYEIDAALPFYDAASLLDVCARKNMSIAQVVYNNELKWRSSEDINSKMMQLWHTMDQSISNGVLSKDEFVHVGLGVKRRSPVLFKRLMTKNHTALYDSSKQHEPVFKETTLPSLPVEAYLGMPKVHGEFRSLPDLDWISLYAIAVNEENASGGRVVTAPTNGAAGTIPAVLKYYLEFLCPKNAVKHHVIMEFLLTASAIGMLYKRGASISAAEMGCQGEVGVACSMAAAALTAVMGGTAQQIENAAEIGMEHNLGLTCDPPMGLVVIPCIERNALAAVKAVTAAQLALNGDGSHRVSLDQVIATMKQTGIDMQSKYKETSQGGLAVNVTVC
jgi:iron-sulfur-dependent L-serine dehydratase beta subunit